MSPYLQFGQISPIEIALEVKTCDFQNISESKESLLEELIVRRELSYNLIYYNNNYDNYEVIPQYAKITLKDHENDKRPYIYTYE